MVLVVDEPRPSAQLQRSEHIAPAGPRKNTCDWLPMAAERRRFARGIHALPRRPQAVILLGHLRPLVYSSALPGTRGMQAATHTVAPHPLVGRRPIRKRSTHYASHLSA